MEKSYLPFVEQIEQIDWLLVQSKKTLFDLNAVDGDVAFAVAAVVENR